jgi:hypothetical protein
MCERSTGQGKGDGDGDGGGGQSAITRGSVGGGNPANTDTSNIHGVCAHGTLLQRTANPRWRPQNRIPTRWTPSRGRRRPRSQFLSIPADGDGPAPPPPPPPRTGTVGGTAGSRLARAPRRVPTVRRRRRSGTGRRRKPPPSGQPKLSPGTLPSPAPPTPEGTRTDVGWPAGPWLPRGAPPTDRQA